ncbi:aromatase/cyclase [Streptomyces nondiastaticus]|uniref:aromatase/cyclase n=1 Tax=Streptomyces nondiastaticus TaxID=3154512 RepID=UPI00344107E4
MSQPKTHFAEHSVPVAAPADVIYDLIADVTGWPRMFSPTVHAERVAGDDEQERIRLWALANGEVRTWTSRRALDRAERRIIFRQEAPQAPMASMGGEWRITPGPDGTCTVVLLHDFAAVDDDPEGLDWIERAVDRNSRAELAALQAAAEDHDRVAELVLSFEDSVTVDGPLSDVHGFIERCERWPERLPHVARLELTETTPGLQLMSMDTRSPDGTIHTTESVRVCFETPRIVYKQTQVPPIMTAHTGEWTFRATPEGVVATSHHTVAINPRTVSELLGKQATIADARHAVRKALGTNSLATLRLAKAYAEGADRA